MWDVWDIRMHAGRTRRRHLAPRFETRRSTTVLLAVLAMAIAAMAAAQTNTAITTFKAGDPAIALPTRGAPVQAWEVRSIAFRSPRRGVKAAAGPSPSSA
jgi:hypothetical protein